MPTVYSDVILSEQITAYSYTHGVDVFIGSTEVSTHIIATSLTIDNILTQQVDRCRFTVRRYGTYNTIPRIGQEVRIYNNGTKIFGGVIIKCTQYSEQYKIIYYDVECEDYTRLLDRKLVADTFQNMTASEIIDDIAANYLQSTGISMAYVTPPDTVISYMAFNYMTISECLTKLADVVLCDWYIDYDKNVHFFEKDARVAPFNLADSTGTYVFESLQIRHDNSQRRNRIIVRGGEYLGDTFTTEFVSDGIQNVYPLAYRYEDVQVTVTGDIWEGGIDNTDPITLYDYLWNKQEKFIRFRGDRIPNSTSSIRISGQPFLPVRVIVQDDDSIASTVSVEGGDGIYEYLILDKSINSQEGARERATAELESYKDTLSEGSFITYEDGLKAGQQITINSVGHGITDTYIINKVTTRMQDNRTVAYDVSLVTTKTFGIIEFLQSLLNKSKKEIALSDDEIVDVIRSFSEGMTVTESVTEQALNYKVSFVAGELSAPSGTKRLFIVDGSPLGNDMHPGQYDIIGLNESTTVVRI